MRRPITGLSDAEVELISALRVTDDFMISIQHRDGRFVVCQSIEGRLGPSIGAGDTFDEAWNCHWTDGDRVTWAAG